jgi:hypothetical protein
MASEPTENTAAMRQTSEPRSSQLAGRRSQPSRDACSTGQAVGIRPKFAAMVGFYP